MIKPFGKRHACFGALGKGGTLHHRYCDRGDTDSMIYSARSHHDTYGKILLVMDSVSIHKAKRLMD